MDIIEGSLLTAARGHSLAAVSASDSTPALMREDCHMGKIQTGPIRWWYKLVAYTL